ncbi:MAG: CDP-alcohol phosphatidyltransferase family protein, partial [Myxococcales bacterium]|nr:CDP-alcohol phosphatidyltransferase family protein [Myxococcales bacterium]
ILDGADGILARAKKMQSEFGRALDGAADSVVAVVTVFPAFFHVYATTHQVLYVYLAVPAILFTLPHLYFYDFYKESYLRMTRPERGGEGQDVANVEAHLAEKKAKGEASSLVNFIITQMMLPMLRSEVAWVGMTNPDALGELRTSKPTAERAEIFRKHNRLPMRFWMAVSLCPHSYIMAICAMFDRLDLYLWIRLVAMNVIFVIGLFVQRRASRATLREWAATDGAGGSAAVGATA